MPFAVGPEALQRVRRLSEETLLSSPLHYRNHHALLARASGVQPTPLLPALQGSSKSFTYCMAQRPQAKCRWSSGGRAEQAVAAHAFA